MTVKTRLNLSHRNVWKVLKNKVDLYNIYTAKAMEKAEEKESHTIHTMLFTLKKIHTQNHNALHSYRDMQICISL